MIELKLTLKYEDTALSAKATGGTPSIVMEAMNGIITALTNPTLKDFWFKMIGDYAPTTEKKSIKMMTALDLENIEIADEMAKNAAKKEAQSTPFVQKIYNVVNKSGEFLRCNKCNGIISWDLRPERPYPLHCDEIGQIVGDGNCPEYP